MTPPDVRVYDAEVMTRRIVLFWRLAYGERLRPDVQDYHALDDSGHPDALFVIDGRLFKVEWEHGYRGDRADWDDGWWPTFSTIVVVDRPWWAFWRRRESWSPLRWGDLADQLADVDATTVL